MAVPHEKQAAIEIRAKIMWGDDPDKVRQEFQSLEHDVAFIDRVIHDALNERRTWFHQMGKRDLLYGFGCLIGFTIFTLASGSTSHTSYRSAGGGVF